ncbi:DUF4129 domain-containing protein [Streptomyces alkaliphilus]|uniref:DUF4129 domain-containing protein n=1 Tax=Streptomyces alkaliphilus TaxID=1472722 RepID=UPI00117D79C0|nr:DUF4129 domain-containing protein [Streptomyces alkaliphilus]MQS09496.1 DUF4129 domain-containing protein [Streptomyces alkaliphilus]
MTGAFGALAHPLAAVVGRALPRSADEPPIGIDRDPAREAAERELSREIYTRHEPGPFRRAFDWLWETVSDLLSRVTLATPGGWLGLLIIVLLVLALLIALRLRLGSVRASGGTGIPDLLGATTRTAAEHRAEADRHAAAGDWDRAVRERMRALVRSLEERALLDPRPGRTADEAAREAAVPMPSFADRLRAAARTFDDVTYGGRHADAADHRRLDDLERELRAARPVTPTGPTGVGAGSFAAPGGVAR